MSTTTGSLLKHHLVWGLGLGAAIVSCIQILTWVGLGLSHVTWILTYVLVIVFAILGGRSLGKVLGKRPEFWRAVVLLLVMILVSRVIYQTYMYVYINFIDPTWVDTVAEFWSGQLEEAGNTPEQIEANITSFRKQWETRHVFTLGIISYGIAQFILGLIVNVLFVVQPWRRREA